MYAFVLDISLKDIELQHVAVEKEDRADVFYRRSLMVGLVPGKSRVI